MEHHSGLNMCNVAASTSRQLVNGYIDYSASTDSPKKEDHSFTSLSTKGNISQTEQTKGNRSHTKQEPINYFDSLNRSKHQEVTEQQKPATFKTGPYRTIIASSSRRRTGSVPSLPSLPRTPSTSASTTRNSSVPTSTPLSSRRHLCNVSTQVTPVKEPRVLSKAEKQKLYRERKKEELGYAEYRRIENERLKQYKVPMAELGEAQREKIRRQNRKRERRREAKRRKSGSVVVVDDEDDDEDDDDDDDEDDDVDDTPTQVPSTKGSSTKTATRKRTSRAVARSNIKIKKLSGELDKSKRKYEKYRKSLNRLKMKLKCKESPSSEDQSSSDDSDSVLNSQQSPHTEDAEGVQAEDMKSPNTKADDDLKSIGVDPKKSKSIKKKLVFAAVVAEEIKETCRNNTQQSKKGIIANILTGKNTKKYRLGSVLNKECGISQRQIKQAGNTKIIKETKRLRVPLVKASLRRKVKEFLERDDKSRMCPGKRDCKKLGAVKVQTKVLHHYMHELYRKFCAEYGKIMSKATFYRLRPKNLLLASNLCRKTCLCTKHQNMALKLNALRWALKGVGGPSIKNNGDTFIKEYFTQSEVDSLFNELDGDIEINYEEWTLVDLEVMRKKEKKTVKKWKVIVKTTKIENFKTLFDKELEAFRIHSYRVAEQYRQLKDLREILPQDHATVQIDFAENYTCTESSEIQSDYYGEKVQVTVHPAVSNFRDDSGAMTHRSAVYISAIVKHDKSMVMAILKKHVANLREIKPDLSMIHYWSDSPFSQYRNRFIFDFVLNHADIFPGIKASWSYFESGHGKGPCDGVGGCVKRMADSAVKQGKVRIQSAMDLFTHCETNKKNIDYFYVTEDQYDEEEKKLEIKDVKPVPGTLHIHCVKKDPENERFILTRTTACHCVMCLSGVHANCDWQSHELQKEPQSSAIMPVKFPFQKGKKGTKRAVRTQNDTVDEASTVQKGKKTKNGTKRAVRNKNNDTVDSDFEVDEVSTVQKGKKTKNGTKRAVRNKNNDTVDSDFEVDEVSTVQKGKKAKNGTKRAVRNKNNDTVDSDFEVDEVSTVQKGKKAKNGTKRAVRNKNNDKVDGAITVHSDFEVDEASTVHNDLDIEVDEASSVHRDFENAGSTVQSDFEVDETSTVQNNFEVDDTSTVQSDFEVDAASAVQNDFENDFEIPIILGNIFQIYRIDNETRTVSAVHDFGEDGRSDNGDETKNEPSSDVHDIGEDGRSDNVDESKNEPSSDVHDIGEDGRSDDVDETKNEPSSDVHDIGEDGRSDNVDETKNEPSSDVHDIGEDGRSDDVDETKNEPSSDVHDIGEDGRSDNVDETKNEPSSDVHDIGEDGRSDNVDETKNEPSRDVHDIGEDGRSDNVDETKHEPSSDVHDIGEDGRSDNVDETKNKPLKYEVGDYVLISVPRSYKKGIPIDYPAEVIKLEGDQMQVSYVKNTHTPGVFKWPDTPDISWTKEKDIVKKLEQTSSPVSNLKTLSVSGSLTSSPRTAATEKSVETDKKKRRRSSGSGVAGIVSSKKKKTSPVGKTSCHLRQQRVSNVYNSIVSCLVSTMESTDHLKEADKDEDVCHNQSSTDLSDSEITYFSPLKNREKINNGDIRDDSADMNKDKRFVVIDTEKKDVNNNVFTDENGNIAYTDDEYKAYRQRRYDSQNRRQEDIKSEYSHYIENGARNGENGARNGENVARNGENRARNGENGARNEENGARNGENGARNGENGTRNEDQDKYRSYKCNFNKRQHEEKIKRPNFRKITTHNNPNDEQRRHNVNHQVEPLQKEYSKSKISTIHSDMKTEENEHPEPLKCQDTYTRHSENHQFGKHFRNQHFNHNIGNWTVKRGDSNEFQTYKLRHNDKYYDPRDINIRPNFSENDEIHTSQQHELNKSINISQPSENKKSLQTHETCNPIDDYSRLDCRYDEGELNGQCNEYKRQEAVGGVNNSEHKIYQNRLKYHNSQSLTNNFEKHKVSSNTDMKSQSYNLVGMWLQDNEAKSDISSNASKVSSPQVSVAGCCASVHDESITTASHHGNNDDNDGQLSQSPKLSELFDEIHVDDKSIGDDSSGSYTPERHTLNINKEWRKRNMNKNNPNNSRDGIGYDDDDDEEEQEERFVDREAQRQFINASLSGAELQALAPHQRYSHTYQQDIMSQSGMENDAQISGIDNTENNIVLNSTEEEIVKQKGFSFLQEMLEMMTDVDESDLLSEDMSQLSLPVSDTSTAQTAHQEQHASTHFQENQPHLTKVNRSMEYEVNTDVHDGQQQRQDGVKLPGRRALHKSSLSMLSTKTKPTIPGTHKGNFILAGKPPIDSEQSYWRTHFKSPEPIRLPRVDANGHRRKVSGGTTDEESNNSTKSDNLAKAHKKKMDAKQEAQASKQVHGRISNDTMYKNPIYDFYFQLKPEALNPVANPSVKIKDIQFKINNTEAVMQESEKAGRKGRCDKEGSSGVGDHEEGGSTVLPPRQDPCPSLASGIEPTAFLPESFFKNMINPNSKWNKQFENTSNRTVAKNLYSSDELQIKRQQSGRYEKNCSIYQIGSVSNSADNSKLDKVEERHTGSSLSGPLMGDLLADYHRTNDKRLDRIAKKLASNDGQSKSTYSVTQKIIADQNITASLDSGVDHLKRIWNGPSTSGNYNNKSNTVHDRLAIGSSLIKKNNNKLRTDQIDGKKRQLLEHKRRLELLRLRFQKEKVEKSPHPVYILSTSDSNGNIFSCEKVEDVEYFEDTAVKQIEDDKVVNEPEHEKSQSKCESVRFYEQDGIVAVSETGEGISVELKCVKKKKKPANKLSSPKKKGKSKPGKNTSFNLDSDKQEELTETAYKDESMVNNDEGNGVEESVGDMNMNYNNKAPSIHTDNNWNECNNTDIGCSSVLGVPDNSVTYEIHPQNALCNSWPNVQQPQQQQQQQQQQQASYWYPYYNPYQPPYVYSYTGIMPYPNSENMQFDAEGKILPTTKEILNFADEKQKTNHMQNVNKFIEAADSHITASENIAKLNGKVEASKVDVDSSECKKIQAQPFIDLVGTLIEEGSKPPVVETYRMVGTTKKQIDAFVTQDSCCDQQAGERVKPVEVKVNQWKHEKFYKDMIRTRGDCNLIPGRQEKDIDSKVYSKKYDAKKYSPPSKEQRYDTWCENSDNWTSKRRDLVNMIKMNIGATLENGGVLNDRDNFSDNLSTLSYRSESKYPKDIWVNPTAEAKAHVKSTLQKLVVQKVFEQHTGKDYPLDRHDFSHRTSSNVQFLYDKVHKHSSEYEMTKRTLRNKLDEHRENDKVEVVRKSVRVTDGKHCYIPGSEKHVSDPGIRPVEEHYINYDLPIGDGSALIGERKFPLKSILKNKGPLGLTENVQDTVECGELSEEGVGHPVEDAKSVEDETATQNDNAYNMSRVGPSSIGSRKAVEEKVDKLYSRFENTRDLGVLAKDSKDVIREDLKKHKSKHRHQHGSKKSQKHSSKERKKKECHESKSVSFKKKSSDNCTMKKSKEDNVGEQEDHCEVKTDETTHKNTGENMPEEFRQNDSELGPVFLTEAPALWDEDFFKKHHTNGSNSQKRERKRGKVDTKSSIKLGSENRSIGKKSESKKNLSSLNSDTDKKHTHSKVSEKEKTKHQKSVNIDEREVKNTTSATPLNNQDEKSNVYKRSKSSSPVKGNKEREQKKSPEKNESSGFNSLRDYLQGKILRKNAPSPTEEDQEDECEDFSSEWVKNSRGNIKRHIINPWVKREVQKKQEKDKVFIQNRYYYLIDPSMGTSEKVKDIKPETVTTSSIRTRFEDIFHDIDSEVAEEEGKRNYIGNFGQQVESPTVSRNDLKCIVKINSPTHTDENEKVQVHADITIILPVSTANTKSSSKNIDKPIKSESMLSCSSSRTVESEYSTVCTNTDHKYEEPGRKVKASDNAPQHVKKDIEEKKPSMLTAEYDERETTNVLRKDPTEMSSLKLLINRQQGFIENLSMSDSKKKKIKKEKSSQKSYPRDKGNKVNKNTHVEKRSTFVDTVGERVKGRRCLESKETLSQPPAFTYCEQFNGSDFGSETETTCSFDDEEMPHLERMDLLFKEPGNMKDLPICSSYVTQNEGGHSNTTTVEREIDCLSNESEASRRSSVDQSREARARRAIAQEQAKIYAIIKSKNKGSCIGRSENNSMVYDSSPERNDDFTPRLRTYSGSSAGATVDSTENTLVAIKQLESELEEVQHKEYKEPSTSHNKHHLSAGPSTKLQLPGTANEIVLPKYIDEVECNLVNYRTQQFFDAKTLQSECGYIDLKDIHCWIPYVEDNGFKYVPVKELSALFRNCAPKCSIAKNTLNKDPGLDVKMCTHQQAILFGLIWPMSCNEQRCYNVHSGDMLLRWDRFVNSYRRIRRLVVELHRNTTRKGSRDCNYTFKGRGIQFSMP